MIGSGLTLQAQNLAKCLYMPFIHLLHGSLYSEYKVYHSFPIFCRLFFFLEKHGESEKFGALHVEPMPTKRKCGAYASVVLHVTL